VCNFVRDISCNFLGRNQCRF